MSINSYIENKSESQILEELESFRQLDVKHLAISEIEETISHLILGYVIKAYIVNPSGLSRTRENLDSEVFLNTKQLWYPDYTEIDEEKWKFGRCNDKGESIFYASTETDTSICEMRPKNNSFITVIGCKPKKEKLGAAVQVIGVNRLININNEYKTLFKDHYDSLSKELGVNFKKNLLIEDFITEQFTQIVPKEEDWKYKISIAITKFFIEAPRVVGILYPSIATNSKGANFALKAEFVDNSLEIERAGMYKINNVTDKEISCHLIMCPETLCTNGHGKITWKNPDIRDMESYTIQK